MYAYRNQSPFVGNVVIKMKRKKILKIIKWIFLIWLLYLVVCMTIPPLFHRSQPKESAAVVYQGMGAAAQERVRSIDDNTDALLWRLRLIEAAQNRLVLTTFDFRDDHSGTDIMAALYQAADRGVEVKILIDGMNGVLRLTGSESFSALASHENVEVRLYNPITLLKPWRNNYRMHDKYLIADDFAYILGGRNTDDLFLGDYADSYNEDRDILVYETVPGKGGSYVQLNEYFEQIWELSCCKPYRETTGDGEALRTRYQELKEEYPEVFAGTDWEQETLETSSIELCTNPIKPENKYPQLWNRLVEEMKQGEQILIQTPYIICSGRMYENLRDICTASNAEMIINSVEIGSNPFGCTDYLNQKPQIRETGLYMYEYLGEQALHTKTILVDDHISIVGSCNMDMRSIYLDTEMMLVIDSAELNAAIRRQTDGLKASSLCVAPDGAEVEGAEYESAGQTLRKKIFYGILRVVIMPVRHLL